MAELKTTAEFRKQYRSDANPFTLWSSLVDVANITDFDLLDDIDTLLAENQRLRDCLAWYADKKKYEWDDSYDGYGVKLVPNDAGERARKALGEE